MNSQLSKLKRELQLRDDTIQKAYLIIEAQNEQLQEFQKSRHLLSACTTARSSSDNVVRKLNFAEYKDDLLHTVDFEVFTHDLLHQQATQQQTRIAKNSFQTLLQELDYWQSQYNLLSQKVLQIFSYLELLQIKNADLTQELLESRNERKQLIKMVQALLEMNDQGKLQFDFDKQKDLLVGFGYDLSHVDQLLNSIVKNASILQSKKQLVGQSQIIEIQEKALEYEKFKQQIIKCLNLQIYDQNADLLLRGIHHLKSRCQSLDDKENDNRWQNQGSSVQIQSKLQSLINSWGQLKDQLQHSFARSGPLGISKLMDLLIQIQINNLQEIYDEQSINLKKLNGFCSQLRVAKVEASRVLEY